MITDISAAVLFFTLEINRIEEAALQEKLKAPDLARYTPWFDAVRAFRPHQLSDEAERLLHDKSVVGRAAWNRLFDETVAAMRLPLDGKELTVDQTLNLLTNTTGAHAAVAHLKKIARLTGVARVV